MNKRLFVASSLVAAMAVVPHWASAAVSLDAFFKDGAVLQRECPVNVFGSATPLTEVTVTFAGQQVTTTAAADGRWCATLSALAASKTGRTLTATAGGASTSVTNVLVGEVWLCCGQSNISSVFASFNARNFGGDEAVAEAVDLQHVRSATFGSTASTPQETTSVSWRLPGADGENVRTWSAVGWAFAAKLARELDVPVAFLEYAIGGERIEPFVSLEGFKSVPGCERYVYLIENPAIAPSEAETLRPAIRYNGGIYPARRFTIRGAVWYQGESNYTDTDYDLKLQALANGWRQAWGYDFPFYVVQLPGFDNSDFSSIREQERRACLALTNAAVACTIDIGEHKDIHPRNKKDVGERLAALALARDYGQSAVTPMGPTPRTVSVSGAAVTVAYDCGTGLCTATKNPIAYDPPVVNAEAIGGFELADADGVWHAASAEKGEGQVVVTAADVSSPTALRYAWGAYPASANLYNAALLPAVPFVETLVVTAPVVTNVAPTAVGTNVVTIAGALAAAGASGAVTVKAAYVVYGETLPTPTVRGEFAAPGSFSVTFDGLSPLTVYSYQLTFVNADGRETVHSGCFKTRYYVVYGSIECDDPVAKFVTTDDGECVVFTNTAMTSVSVRFANDVVLSRALLVGGGGGGGTLVGGGGGAGGVTNFSGALELPAGTELTLSIGKGGAAATSMNGNGSNGEDSTLTLGNELYRALGGGGGASFSTHVANAGGCGGGASVSATVAAGLQGGNGGKTDGSAYHGAGGGGAGEAGGDAPSDYFEGAKGGDGIVSDITGVEVWYAGGGGGGENTIWASPETKSGGAGGAGGGGKGGSPKDYTSATAGVDGLGGGGGGGGNTTNPASEANGNGARGGSGTVILSYLPQTAQPFLSSVKATDLGITYVQLGGTLVYAGKNGGEVSIDAAVAPVGSSLPAKTRRVENLVAGDAFVVTVTGLVAGTEYAWEIEAINAAGASVTASGTFRTEIAGTPGRIVGGTVTSVGYDTVVTLTNPSGGDVDFTVEENPTVRVLMVGGGGGGGHTIGGGGGAGGVITNSALALVAGAYTATIGAGGAGGTSGTVSGTNGGDTVLTGPTGELLRALGGGAGASWSVKSGAVGGSGGGSTGSTTAGGEGTTGQGFAGGASGGSGTEVTAGGGGGGGACGGKGANSQGGDGGAGCLSDITGLLCAYAGGGGAGGCLASSCRTFGAGGSGIGGDGSANGSNLPGEDGADNTGSGGGGGSWSPGTKGGKGGSGVVILRYRGCFTPETAPNPCVQITAIEATEIGMAKVSYRVTWAGGTAQTVDLRLRVGRTASELEDRGIVATDVIGSGICYIDGLTPSVCNYVQLVADNGTATGYSTVASLDCPGPLVSDDPAMNVIKLPGVGGRYAYVFTNAARTVNVSASVPVYVREVLLVGGGGGGGAYLGGGGGAGGFTNESYGLTYRLEADSAGTLCAGGGGAGAAKNGHGTSGTSSTLTWGTLSFEAFGGGYGGGWNGGQYNGDTGGCGGGATVQNDGPAAGTQGGAGGVGIANKPVQYCAGGGGGAGGDGEDSGLHPKRAAAGGIGKHCSITGTPVWYAGGGGAGGFSSLIGGLGGLGGGGQGSGEAGPDAVGNGVDGLGGGGGGSAASTQAGGNGGAGTVILLVSPADGTPIERTAGTVVWNGFATVGGTLESAGGEATSVEVSVQLLSATLKPLGDEQTVATGLAANGSWSYTASGLTTGTKYALRVKLVNNLGVTATRTELFTVAPTRLVSSDDATMRVCTNDTDLVCVFTNASELASLVVEQPLYLREWLVVGGGGAGGGYVGAGGGAGGVIHGLPDELVYLEMGSKLSMLVGRGGLGRASARGENGIDTSFWYGDTQLTALGGGGGGFWSNDAASHAGLSGGCGGGSTIQYGETRGLGSQGGDGGVGIVNKPVYYCAGGGGGAGGDGEDSGVTAGYAAAGGVGIMSTITGEEVWYAGGGGAAGFSSLIGGLGGLGGGGQGDGENGPAAAVAGTDGLGGGGGGSAQSTAVAANGGCGTVIVRFTLANGLPVEASTPIATWDTFATVGGTLVTPGHGADTATVYVQLLSSAQAPLRAEQRVAQGLGVGDTWSFALTDLTLNETYGVRVRIVNNLGIETTRTESFTVRSGEVFSGNDATMRVLTNASDFVCIFTNTASLAELVVQQPLYLREWLVVGGGGAGGSHVGAGGGAGGVIHGLPAEPVLIEKNSSLEITVGAGGVGVVDKIGGNGGNSTLKFQGETLTALGGGGGGGWDSTRKGADGGCGGGSTREAGSTTVECGLGSQGGNGGIGIADRPVYYTSGGGGGAGGNGEDSGLLNSRGAAGGVGIVASITGTEVWYAGGGGGAGFSGSLFGGYGGQGGGGQGGGDSGPLVPGNGVDGLGGGGGGENDNNLAGGNGGCGTVIVRFSLANGVPEESATTCEAGDSYLSVGGVIRSVGGGAKTMQVMVSVKAADSAIWSDEVVAAAGLQAGSHWAYTFRNLEPSTAYDVRIRLINDLGLGLVRETSASTLAVSAAGSISGDGEVAFVGADRVITFANAEGGDFNFTVTGTPTVWLLGVAGGGAGGYTIGGGGGAGGFVEKPVYALATGAYTVHIGAGGQPSAGTTTRGGTGEDTVLTGPSGELLRLYGGGGGGSWEQVAAAGGDGGSGGGGTNTKNIGGSSTNEQGNVGGNSSYGNSNITSGGGGGAGGPGEDGYATTFAIRAGNGGAGVYSDISGTLLAYAGGGGGGGCLTTTILEYGRGGSGVGGDGSADGSKLPGEDGSDNTGSGGGGGSWSPGTTGGKGGSGVLILRYRDGANATAATIDWVASETNRYNEARIFWRVGWPGAGATGVRVTAKFGLASGVYTKTCQLAADSVGLDSALLTELYPSAVNYVRLEATNDCGTVESAEFTVASGPRRKGIIILVR